MPDPEKLPRDLRLGAYFIAAWRRQRATRPVSVYLLGAIAIVTLLGVQVVYVQGNPRKFAFLLALYFIFFIVVIFRALLDFMDILRAHIKDSGRLFRSTVGDPTFITTLGQNVAAERGQAEHSETR